MLLEVAIRQVERSLLGFGDDVGAELLELVCILFYAQVSALCGVQVSQC